MLAAHTGYVQANASYGVTPWIAIGVEAGWQESDIDGIPTGIGQSAEVGIVPIMADIIVRVPEHPFHESLVPYGVLGLSAAHSACFRRMSSNSTPAT